MDTRKIKKLIELVKETGIGELEVKSGEDSVRINCQQVISTPATQVMTSTAASAATPAMSESSAPQKTEPTPTQISAIRFA